MPGPLFGRLTGCFGSRADTIEQNERVEWPELFCAGSRRGENARRAPQPMRNEEFAEKGPAAISPRCADCNPLESSHSTRSFDEVVLLVRPGVETGNHRQPGAKRGGKHRDSKQRTPRMGKGITSAEILRKTHQPGEIDKDET